VHVPNFNIFLHPEVSFYHLEVETEISSRIKNDIFRNKDKFSGFQWADFLFKKK
jgi:hypothetical protein